MRSGVASRDWASRLSRPGPWDRHRLGSVPIHDGEGRHPAAWEAGCLPLCARDQSSRVPAGGRWTSPRRADAARRSRAARTRLGRSPRPTWAHAEMVFATIDCERERSGDQTDAAGVSVRDRGLCLVRFLLRAGELKRSGPRRPLPLCCFAALVTPPGSAHCCRTQCSGRTTCRR